MRIKIAVLAAFVSALSCVAPAFADTLTLTGTGGVTSDGVSVYPYLFTVTEGGKTVTNVSLSCLNFDREITVGESWTVDEYAIPMGTGTLDGESYANYRADAWLNTQYSNPSYTATQVQFAIWSIMDPSGVAGKQGFDATAQTLAATAKTMASSLPASFFTGDILFVPDPSGAAGWNPTEPQIFIASTNPIAPTPEPSSLMLFGTGLAGMAGLLRQRSMRVAQAAAKR